VLEKKEKLKAAGARARALFPPPSTPAVSNAAGAPAWDDWDSGELDGEMAWEKEDDGGGLPSAGGEAVYDDDVMDINGGTEWGHDWNSPKDGAASGMPWDDNGQVDDGSSLFADDPEGGLGTPARLADMMSMLHVRLLSLEVSRASWIIKGPPREPLNGRGIDWPPPIQLSGVHKALARGSKYTDICSTDSME
jgi:hypothetical protein